jgi:hypothetical protein
MNFALNFLEKILQFLSLHLPLLVKVKLRMIFRKRYPRDAIKLSPSLDGLRLDPPTLTTTTAFVPPFVNWASQQCAKRLGAQISASAGVEVKIPLPQLPL